MAPQPESVHMAPQPVLEWFIAFTSYRGLNKLYRWFLPYGFGHVFAFAPFGGGVLILDPHEGGVVLAATPPLLGGNANMLGVTPSTFIVGLKAALPDVTIVQTKSALPQNKKHFSMFLPTCVTAIKSVVGMQSWAITPWQFFQNLKQKGAVVVDAAVLKTLQEADICARMARNQSY